MNFDLVCRGTISMIRDTCRVRHGGSGGRRPIHIVDMIKNNEIAWSSTLWKSSATQLRLAPDPHVGVVGPRATFTTIAGGSRC
jgi:hypothetical protein